MDATHQSCCHQLGPTSLRSVTNTHRSMDAPAAPVDAPEHPQPTGPISTFSLNFVFFLNLLRITRQSSLLQKKKWFRSVAGDQH